MYIFAAKSIDLIGWNPESFLSKTKHEADVFATLSGKQRVAMEDKSCLDVYTSYSYCELVLPMA